MLGSLPVLWANGKHDQRYMQWKQQQQWYLITDSSPAKACTWLLCKSGESLNQAQANVQQQTLKVLVQRKHRLLLNIARKMANSKALMNLKMLKGLNKLFKKQTAGALTEILKYFITVPCFCLQ